MGREMRKAKKGKWTETTNIKRLFEKNSNLLLWEFLKIYTYMTII